MNFEKYLLDVKIEQLEFKKSIELKKHSDSVRGRVTLVGATVFFGSKIIFDYFTLLRQSPTLIDDALAGLYIIGGSIVSRSYYKYLRRKEREHLDNSFNYQEELKTLRRGVPNEEIEEKREIPEIRDYHNPYSPPGSYFDRN